MAFWYPAADLSMTFFSFFYPGLPGPGPLLEITLGLQMIRSFRTRTQKKKQSSSHVYSMLLLYHVFLKSKPAHHHPCCDMYLPRRPLLRTRPVIHFVLGFVETCLSLHYVTQLQRLCWRLCHMLAHTIVCQPEQKCCVEKLILAALWRWSGIVNCALLPGALVTFSSFSQSLVITTRGKLSVAENIQVHGALYRRATRWSHVSNFFLASTTRAASSTGQNWERRKNTKAVFVFKSPDFQEIDVRFIRHLGLKTGKERKNRASSSAEQAEVVTQDHEKKK